MGRFRHFFECKAKSCSATSEKGPFARFALLLEAITDIFETFSILRVKSKFFKIVNCLGDSNFEFKILDVTIKI